MTTVRDYEFQRGLSTLQRPRYSAGLLLEDEDLTTAVEYTRDITRLLFRSFFGCGVVCGLDVTASLTCLGTKVEVQVARGVALDCMGNPIYLPKADKVSFDADCKPLPKCLWVTVCYFEKCCRPKDVSCSPDDDMQKVPTRQQQGYEIRLYPKRPKCICWCEDKQLVKDCEEDEAKMPDECCEEHETPDVEVTATPKMTSQAAMTAQTTSGAMLQGQTKIQSVRTYSDTTGGGQPTLDPICECFKDHYDGKCDCECGCDCVVVGVVRLTKTVDEEGRPADLPANKEKDIPLWVNRDVVRWIRPMLIGYRKCFDPKPVPKEQG